MILPDANLLLYAYDRSTPHHERARSWWEQSLTSSETVGLSWQCVTAFIRIGTNARAYTHPLSGVEAGGIVQSWLQQPNTHIVTPSTRHWDIFTQLIIENQAIGPLVMDAHLAALAIENGAILYSHDADFTRFKGLRIRDPLVA